MSDDKPFNKNPAAISETFYVNPLIQFVFKKDALEQRLPPGVIQLLLAYSNEILAEIERETNLIIDAPSQMRELSGISETDPASNGAEVQPCR